MELIGDYLGEMPKGEMLTVERQHFYCVICFIVCVSTDGFIYSWPFSLIVLDLNLSRSLTQGAVVYL